MHMDLSYTDPQSGVLKYRWKGWSIHHRLHEYLYIHKCMCVYVCIKRATYPLYSVINKFHHMFCANVSTCVRMHMCTHVYVRICVCMYTCGANELCVHCIQSTTYSWHDLRTCIHVYTCAYVYMCVCVYVCMCLYVCIKQALYLAY